MMSAYYVISRVGYAAIIISTPNEGLSNSSRPAPSLLDFGGLPHKEQTH